jgi:DNA-binding GntR family transcriptional regulator
VKALADETSLTDRVYDELRSAILAGELTPGSLYSVVEISNQLGVSRTPVREALLRFAANGMVRFERSRGVRILEVSLDDIREIYGLRLMLEVPSAYRAATEMSEEDQAVMTEAFEGMSRACELGDEPMFQRHDLVFHEAILRGAGNRRVVDAVANTRSQMHARGLSTTRTRTLQDILQVHGRIYDAVRDRDAVAASEAVHAHLAGTMSLLLRQTLDKPTHEPKFPVLEYAARTSGSTISETRPDS